MSRDLLPWLILALYALFYLALFLFPVIVIVICSMWWAKLGRRR